MKKVNEVQFYQNGKVQVPIAIGVNNLDISQDTLTSTLKSFEEFFAIELAGEYLRFSADRSETWDYVDEGLGTHDFPSEIDDFTLECLNNGESRRISVNNIDVLNLDEEDEPYFHNGGVRAEWIDGKLDREKWLYLVESRPDEPKEGDKPFIAAIMTYAAAFNQKAYRPNWQSSDQWNWDLINEDHPSLDTLRNINEAQYSTPMVVDVPFDEVRYQLFRDHIHNQYPHLDINFLDSINQAVLKLNERIAYEYDTDKLAEKFLSVISKFDKETQKNMCSFINKKSFNEAKSFVNSSHKRIFEPELPEVSDSSLTM